MLRAAVVVFLLGALAAMQAVAAETPAESRILVTVDDPGLSGQIRSGAPRPGYNRRRGAYKGSREARRIARQLADRYSIRIVEEWPIEPLRVHCIVYAVAEGTAMESLLAALHAEALVESAQRMQTFDVNASHEADGADPYSRAQRSLDILGLQDAHRWSTGSGVRIAIVDTGADLDHADLRGQVEDFRDFVPEGGNAREERHGTAVAGIIAARDGNGVGIVGVAPASHTSLLRACWSDPPHRRGRCNTLTIAKALAHAIELEADVINLSLDGPSDPLLERLAAVAMGRGAVIVAAAPRGATGNEPSFPASLPGVITVREYEAADSADPSTARRLAAPGVDILVLVPNDRYDFASGSSLAAAHVSGIVSLLLSRNPDLDDGDIVRLLASSSKPPSNSVHACRALAVLLDEPGCSEDTSAQNE